MGTLYFADARFEGVLDLAAAQVGVLSDEASIVAGKGLLN